MIYLDSNVFITATIKSDERGQKCRELIRDIATGETKAASSALTFDEIFWRVKKEGGFDMALIAARTFLEMPNLVIIETNETILLEAYNLIKNYKLDPRDAIHAASAIVHGIFTIISDDPDFDRIKEMNRKRI
ncbi:MAG: type II toxin-antitoxin system VapC family toxin [Candidatus Aenigmarchaeota archaeon]|nr:type II toxin-antitoxin system VapC family toxin [Candidatus Aenigmarchaeota archaeon]